MDRGAASDTPPFTRIGIAGVGLIGGSVALAARRRWPAIRITALDRQDVIDAAIATGAADLGAASIATLADVDLLVLAAPIPGIVASIDAAAHAGLTAIVTDVGSTKRRILAAAAAAGLTHFIGGHPMAGAERAGLSSARATLFDGRPWFLAPASAPAIAVERIEHFVRGLGAVPRRVEADQHDRTMAYASHLPQLLASTLMATAGSNLGADGLGVSGPALREMTRLAASPPDVWRGILDSNADFIAEALSAFVATMPTTAPLDVVQWVDRIFQEARLWRERLEQDAPAIDAAKDIVP